jgi:predicted DNA-binding ribbon-helix-helix protein
MLTNNRKCDNVSTLKLIKALVASNEKMRAFEFMGRRRAIRLDEGTWQAVDWLAAQRGVKWAELAREWVANDDSGADENLTRAVRGAAMDALLVATVFNEQRGADLAVMQSHPLLKDSGILDSNQLDSILRGARVHGESSFGGFSILFGLDENGQD